MRLGPAVLVLACAGLSSGVAQAAPTAQQTADGFLALYGTFHPSDGIPDVKTRGALAAYLSPALAHLLDDAAAAEARFAAKNKDSPPLLEGDIFTSNFEGATSFAVRSCAASGETVACVMALSYDPKDGKNKPTDWNDRLYLVKVKGDWRIDDIGYGATWAFGNKGRLSDTLKEAIGDSAS
jgi:hypothetical protein